MTHVECGKFRPRQRTGVVWVGLPREEEALKQDGRYREFEEPLLLWLLLLLPGIARALCQAG